MKRALLAVPDPRVCHDCGQHFRPREGHHVRCELCFRKLLVHYWAHYQHAGANGAGAPSDAESTRH